MSISRSRAGFMRSRDNKSIQEGGEYQAYIPSRSQRKKTASKVFSTISGSDPKMAQNRDSGAELSFFKANYVMQDPNGGFEGFDMDRHRIREIGLKSTGKSILAPQRDSSGFLVWDPSVLTPEFFTKCAYLNQFLLEKDTGLQLRMDEFKVFFEKCGMDEARFVDQILNFEHEEKSEFRKFVKYAKKVDLEIRYFLVGSWREEDSRSSSATSDGVDCLKEEQ